MPLVNVVGQGGIGSLDNLNDLILSYLPLHYWRMDEASGNLIDRGSQGVDLTLQGTDPGRQQELVGDDPGPCNSIDFSAANNWFRASSGIATPSIGTIIVFNRGDVSLASAQTYISWDSANETDNFSVGTGARGVNGGAFAITQAAGVIDGGSFLNYRFIRGADNLQDDPRDDSAWHMHCFTQDGNGIKVYLDGVRDNNEQTETGGTAPGGVDNWIGQNVSPTRITVGNGRFGSGTENVGNTRFGPVVVLPTVLTDAQIEEMWDYVYQDLYSMILDTGRNAVGEIRGPLFFWAMDEASGDFIRQGSDNLPGRNLVPRNSPTREVALAGRASSGPFNGGDQTVRGAEFDGVNQYAITTDGAIDQNEQVGTMMMLMLQQTAGSQQLAGQANGGTDLLRWFRTQYNMRRNGSGNAHTADINNGSPFEPVVGQVALLGWNHRNLGPGSTDFYVNGQLIPDAQMTVVEMGTGLEEDFFDDSSAAVDFAVAARSLNGETSQDLFFDGVIGGVAFWSPGGGSGMLFLGPSQHKRFAAKAGLFSTSYENFIQQLGPAWWHKFNESSGDVIDYGSAGDDAVEVGSPATSRQIASAVGLNDAMEPSGAANNLFRTSSRPFAGSDGTIVLILRNPTAAPPGSWLFNYNLSFDDDDAAVRLTDAALAWFTSTGIFNDNDFTRSMLNLPDISNSVGFIVLAFRKPHTDHPPEVYINGGRHYSHSDASSGSSTEDPGRWFNSFAGDVSFFNRNDPQQAGWGGAGSAMDESLVFPQNLTPSEIAQIVTLSGVTVAADEDLEFEDLIFELHPRLLYRFNEASGSALDTGRGEIRPSAPAVTLDIPEVNAPAARQVTNGDQSASVDKNCVSLVKSDGYALDVTAEPTAFSQNFGQAASFILVFRKEAGVTEPESAFSMENDAGDFAFRVNFKTGSEIEFEVFTTPSTNGGQLTTSGQSIDDDNWHVLGVNKGGNTTTPPRVWLDGVELTVGAGTLVDNIQTGFKNLWINDVSGSATKFALGGRAAVGLGNIIEGFSGELDYLAFFDFRLTEFDHAALANKYLVG